MTQEQNIRINPSKPSTLEFEVAISGLDKVVPIVRFVIKNANRNVDWMVDCKKLEGKKWQASFPKFKEFHLSKSNFWIEVLVDEFYFKPAEGVIEFINTPDVSFARNTINKPTVTTSFSKPKKKITEASGGPEVTGQYAPTNGLLSVEENPEYTQGTVKVAKHDLNDQSVDKSKLKDITNMPPTPGTGHPYVDMESTNWLDDLEDDDLEDDDLEDDDLEDDDLEDELDPIAEKVSSIIGRTRKPTHKGSLFNRDSDGKAIVPGLESKKQQQEKLNKSQTVKDLLT